MVNRLKDDGYLDFAPDKRLRPGKWFFERELVDTVRAGQPHPANDVSTDIISIDEYIIDSPSRTIMLTVKGDSMVEAGLMPNDTVIVKKAHQRKTAILSWLWWIMSLQSSTWPKTPTAFI